MPTIALTVNGTPHRLEALAHEAAGGDQEREVVARGQVISPALSSTLIGMMNHVVTTVPFYRDRTLIKGYEVGGKTGTAQIWDSAKHNWKHNLFNYSFIGYVGKGRPQLVIAITIREAKPNSVSQGNLPLNVESYALYRRVATDAMATLDLPPAGQTAGSTAP